MTRPTLAELRAEAIPPPDPVMDAVDVYRARFGDTPWMIHDAVRTGRPLTGADMKRVEGHGYPPPGASS